MLQYKTKVLILREIVLCDANKKCTWNLGTRYNRESMLYYYYYYDYYQKEQ